MRLANHCIRHEDEIANKLVLRQPNDGRERRGRQKMNYIEAEAASETIFSNICSFFPGAMFYTNFIEHTNFPGGPVCSSNTYYFIRVFAYFSLEHIIIFQEGILLHRTHTIFPIASFFPSSRY